MIIKITILCAFLTIALTNCRGNKAEEIALRLENDKLKKENKRITDSVANATTKFYQPSVTIKTMPGSVPVAEGTTVLGQDDFPDHTDQFREVNYQTLLELKQHIFSIGSSESDVQSLKGSPEMKDVNSKGQNVWLYKDGEIYFKNGYVDDLSSAGIKHYCSVSRLLESKNEIARSYGMELIKRTSNNR